MVGKMRTWSKRKDLELETSDPMETFGNTYTVLFTSRYAPTTDPDLVGSSELSARERVVVEVYTTEVTYIKALDLADKVMALLNRDRNMDRSPKTYWTKSSGRSYLAQSSPSWMYLFTFSRSCIVGFCIGMLITPP